MMALLAPAPARVRIRHLDEPEHPAPVRAATSLSDGSRRVLHVGCGEPGPDRLHAIFRGAAWREVRIDLDPAVRPDIVASLADLSAVPDGSADAVWCSHSLEHLCAHEVPVALAEFRRVLSARGFLLVRSPDLAAVAAALLTHGLDHVAYRSAAGPVTVADMIYGHAASVARGNAFMRHGTGFTDESLRRLLGEAGFPDVRTTRTPDYTVWAAAFMPGADTVRVLRALARRGLRLAPARPSA